MALPPFDPFIFANHFTLTVESTSNDLAHTWRNSIDLAYATAITPSPSDAPIVAFWEWIQGMQRADSHVSLAILRPWSRGDLPFSEQGALWTQVLSLTGTCYGEGGMVGSVGDHNTTIGEVCLEAIKPVFSGRGKPGRLFLRNLFRDIDITATAGGPPIPTATVPGPNATNFATWADSKLGDFVEDSPLPRYVIVHWSRTHDPTTAFDSAMQLPVWKGPTTHDLSHKAPR